ncbi:MAG: helix-turn-helix domain-containing protein [Gammaproteobacteria bacterium]
MAIATHVANVRGHIPLRCGASRGGLAPWQERRAKELLIANLTGRVCLSDLACACDLSIRHFTRAFRQSTGMAPHRWLVQQRLDRAEGLLASSSRSLAQIAKDCGFADQSHFTRVFQRTFGLTPGLWRRTRSSEHAASTACPRVRLAPLFR